MHTNREKFYHALWARSKRTRAEPAGPLRRDNSQTPNGAASREGLTPAPSGAYQEADDE